jgi:hypothetical protein
MHRNAGLVEASYSQRDDFGVFFEKWRTAQNSPPGFCAASVGFGKVSLTAQCDPAPIKIFNRRALF